MPIDVSHLVPKATKTPWQFQLVGSTFLTDTANGRGILGDEMGVGKTGQAYLAYKTLNPGMNLPCLLVGRKNAIAAWRRQAHEWGCPKPVFISGNAAQRAKLWKTYGGSPFRFVATTREALVRDYKAGVVPQKWHIIFDDEAHRDSNRKNLSFKILKSMTHKSRCSYFIALTGSPMERGATDLWALLHLCDPVKWSSYWAFVNKYYLTQQSEMGNMEILSPRPGNTFRQDIKKYFLRRLKREVREDMPPKVRDMNIWLDLTPEQARIYNQLMQENIAELSRPDVLSVTPTVLARLTRLRQLLVCPRILDPALSDGASVDNLIEMLEETSDRHMVVFTPFTDAIPFVKERLIKEGYSAESIVEFRGGLEPDEVIRRCEVFQERRGIALCSISFAESFDLVPATWGYFLGPSWSVRENLQAEDRLDRIIIEWSVTLYYPRYKGCIDAELIFDGALDGKANRIAAMLGSPKEVLLRMWNAEAKAKAIEGDE